MDPTSLLLALALGVVTTVVVPPSAEAPRRAFAPFSQWVASVSGVGDIPIADGPPRPILVTGRAFHRVPERSGRTAAGLRIAVSTRLSLRGAVHVEHERLQGVTYDRPEPPVNPFFYTHRLRSTYRSNLTTFLLAFRPEGWRRLRPAYLAGVGFERSALDEEIFDRAGTTTVDQRADRITVPTLALGADAEVPLTQNLAIAVGVRVHIVWTTGYPRIRPYAGVQWCIGCR